MREEQQNAIITERLLLRPFTEEDGDAVLHMLSDPVMNTFLPWFPLASREEAQAFLRARLLWSAGSYRYAICPQGNAEPVGYVCLNGDDSRDLGYGLKTEFWHRGWVSEAAGAVLNAARRAGIPYVTATHDRENPRSGAVMKRLGMRYCYSYVEQWQPKNIPVVFRMYQLNFLAGQEYVYRKYWDASESRFVEEGV